MYANAKRHSPRPANAPRDTSPEARSTAYRIPDAANTPRRDPRLIRRSSEVTSPIQGAHSSPDSQQRPPHTPLPFEDFSPTPPLTTLAKRHRFLLPVPATRFLSGPHVPPINIRGLDIFLPGFQPTLSWHTFGSNSHAAAARRTRKFGSPYGLPPNSCVRRLPSARHGSPRLGSGHLSLFGCPRRRWAGKGERKQCISIAFS